MRSRGFVRSIFDEIPSDEVGTRFNFVCIFTVSENDFRDPEQHQDYRESAVKPQRKLDSKLAAFA